MESQVKNTRKKNSKSGLTPKQKKMYDAIVIFIKANRHSPSYEELKQLVGYRSKCAVHDMVYQLKRRRWISMEKGAWRSISIL